MLHLQEDYRQEALELMPAWHQWLQESEGGQAQASVDAPSKERSKALSH
jgi:hypothetical protein